MTYIATIAYAPILLVATSATKTSTLEEFIEAGRKKQGGLSIASPGQGTAGHLMIAGIANKAKTNFLHVPYKDAGQRLTDSIAGTVDGWVENPTGPMVQQIRAGKLKLLAVAAPRRLADFPDVPTFAEAGYADVQFYTSWLLVGPKGLAPDLTDKYNKAVNAGIKSSEFAKLFAISYALPAGGTADECAKAVQAEGKLAAKVIKDSNIRLE